MILVHGAMTDRAHPTLRDVAAALAPWFTVVNYDRRGRGDSGDTRPYAVEREVEDLAALVAEVGGRAMVFGGSSGAALALEAALRLPEIARVAAWEPPYRVVADAPALPDGFAARLEALVDDGRPGDAVEEFMVRGADIPAEAVAAMRGQPFWEEAEAIARTLAYEAAVVGPGGVPSERLASLGQPTLVLTGQDSPAWMVAAGKAVAAMIPGASYRVLDGQAHNVSPVALAPELLEFFSG
ncbi:alpha/beta fold hydrolase [Spongiactinospora sp. 9N601]|uniref:alpha/beta fold hydrolase n=1 Tax=Spongiactinospora sp. 9N601 TaxID=3375149 RepID=UPI0037A31B9F